MTNKKSHTRLRLVPKSTTLDDLEGHYAVSKHMRLSEPTTKIWMKIDPFCQRRRCSLVTLASGNIRFMGIFAEEGVPWGESVKRQCDCRERQFSAFSLAISSKTLEMRPTLLHSDTQSSSSFQWSQNAWPWMTLNDYFALNSVFAPVCLASDRASVRVSSIIIINLFGDREKLKIIKCNTI